MGALISACQKALTIKNTGSECNESMGPAVMFFLIPPGATWTQADLADFTTFVTAKIHAPKAQRWYPIFGPSVPIRRINLNKEADVLFTADDGTQIFIRYGVLNRAFGTTEAGLCYADSLMSFLRSGYTVIEIDNADQVMHRKNTDGTFGGLKTTFMYAPSIDVADFKNPGFVNFQISMKPEEYVRNGVIFQADDSSLTDIIGLIDVEVYQNGAVTSAGATRATATDTLTIGATGDSVDIKVLGVSLAGAPVVQTVTETTATLLAAKAAAAITANAAVNGGFTATNAAGVLTISAPASKGASINGTVLTATIVGGITATPGGPFAGGITGTAILKFGIKTICAGTDLIAEFGNTLVNAALVVITNSSGQNVVPSLVTAVGGVGQATIPDIADTYTISLVAPAALLAAEVDGYEEITPAVIQVV